MPVVVVQIDDKTSLEYAILENVQRADLNPIEEAEALAMAEFSHAGELSKVIGKSRSHIANTLRLTDLPVGVRKVLMRKLTAGHGRALSVKDPVQVAKRVLDEGLSVRQVEEIAQTDNATPEEGRGQGGQTRQDGEGPGHAALERRCRTCSASPSASTTRAAAANCASSTRPWSSSTACAGG